MDGRLLSRLHEGRQFEGKTYAIPFQRSTPVFYYNKDAFREAGLDPEAPPTTWDEMIEVGKQLTVKDANGNVTRWGTRIPTLGLGGAWLFGGLVVSKGDVLTTETGTEARIDTPATLASLEFLLRSGRRRSDGAGRDLLGRYAQGIS